MHLTLKKPPSKPREFDVVTDVKDLRDRWSQCLTYLFYIKLLHLCGSTG